MTNKLLSWLREVAINIWAVKQSMKFSVDKHSIINHGKTKYSPTVSSNAISVILGMTRDEFRGYVNTGNLNWAIREI